MTSIATTELESLRFAMPYNIYDQYMFGYCEDLAYAFKYYLGIGSIVGLNKNNAEYSAHIVYKINNIYIDIRGVFLSDIELLSEPVRMPSDPVFDSVLKVRRNSKIEFKNLYENAKIVNEEEYDYLKIEYFNEEMFEYSTFIVKLILERYPMLSQYVESCK